MARLPANWDNLAALVRAGIEGVEAGRNALPALSVFDAFTRH